MAIRNNPKHESRRACTDTHQRQLMPDGPGLTLPHPSAGALPAAVAAARTQELLALGGCVLILLVKAALISRLNINWDEFYFLTHVHAQARGELHLFLQGAYTHLFTWLTLVPGDEIVQVIAGRWVMWLLLVTTAILVWLLARDWVGGASAAIAPLGYLAMLAIAKHGGSFRSDSLLAPLLLLATLLFSRGAIRPRLLILAGIAIGAAFAVTAKAVLFAPVFVGLAFLRPAPAAGARGRVLDAVLRLSVTGVAAAATATLLLLMHRLSMTATVYEGVDSFAQRTLRKTVLDVPFLPRGDYFAVMFDADRWIWILLMAGVISALARRRAAVLCASLALLPVLFYRNAFPYFYVVMLAPVCVLGAAAVAEAATLLATRRPEGGAPWMLCAVPVLLSVHAALTLFDLRADEQAQQRRVVAAVHNVFPRPVPYIDHSGMIASFRKVNFFMSTWGVEAYKNNGVPFMPAAIAAHRPPLVLVNRPVLQPGTLPFMRLLPIDQRLLEGGYVKYWGPIRIAGADVDLSAHEVTSVSLPFPGPYRLLSTTSVLVNGRSVGNRAVLHYPGGALTLALPEGATMGTRVRLVWAEAREPPGDVASEGLLYSPL